MTLNPIDLEVMRILYAKKKMSISSLSKKIIKEWLEDYEDMLLARRTEEAEKRSEGKATHSFEEVWKECCM